MAILHYRGVRVRARVHARFSGSLIRISNIENVIDPIKRAFALAGLRQRNARLDQRPLFAGQIAWIAELRSSKLKFPFVHIRWQRLKKQATA